jgi:excisionase family DNA binding protein
MLFEGDILLTIQEVAEKLNVSESTIRGWVYERKIPYYKLGDSRRSIIRFQSSVLNEWLCSFEMIAKDSKVNNVDNRPRFYGMKKSKKDILDEYNKFLIGLRSQLNKNEQPE